MSQNIEALSSIIKPTSYTHLDIDNSSVAVHDNNFTDLVSGAFKQFSKKNSLYMERINSLNPFDPDSLLELQPYMRNRSSLILLSILAQKTTAAIQNLEKSQ